MLRLISKIREYSCMWRIFREYSVCIYYIKASRNRMNVCNSKHFVLRLSQTMKFSNLTNMVENK